MSAQNPAPDAAAKPAPASTPAASERQGIREIFSDLWREQRQQGIFTHKGVIKQQLQLLGFSRNKELLRSTIEAARGLRAQGVRGNSEPLTFDEAMRKHRLTEVHLVALADRHKALQVAFYFLAVACLGYAWYLALGPTFLSAVPALATSVALSTYGYINAYRAWQIKHRKLISFDQALAIPSTYFVL